MLGGGAPGTSAVPTARTVTPGPVRQQVPDKVTHLVTGFRTDLELLPQLIDRLGRSDEAAEKRRGQTGDPQQMPPLREFP